MPADLMKWTRLRVNTTMAVATTNRNSVCGRTKCGILMYGKRFHVGHVPERVLAYILLDHGLPNHRVFKARTA